MSRIVVSDASPLNYLLLIHEVELLPRLFSEVLIPPAVAAELLHDSAPEPVAAWMRGLPPWLKVVTPKHVPSGLDLDPGETEAIALALETGVRPILMDERKGRRVAAQQGLLTVGTLAILEQSAKKGWLDFERAIAKLGSTTFRLDGQLITEARERLRESN